MLSLHIDEILHVVQILILKFWGFFLIQILTLKKIVTFKNTFLIHFISTPTLPQRNIK